MNAINLYLLLGLILIFLELFVFAFSVFWLFILGLSALITAFILFLYPENIGHIQIFTITLVITSIVLYYPLYKWRKKHSNEPGNTLIGKNAQALSHIDNNSGQVKYFGTTYNARSSAPDELINKDERVKVIAIEDITLIVTKIK